LQNVQTGDIEPVAAAVSATKTRPKLLEDAAAAILLALILGIAAAFIAEALDTRVRDTEEVTEILGLPLLARIAAFPRGVRDATRLPASLPATQASENFRMLRAALEAIDDEASAILVTSAVAGEGKTTVAANTAVILARGGRSVALVDLDLHRPTSAKLFNLPLSLGATSVLAGESSLADAIASFKFVDNVLTPGDRRWGDRRSGGLWVLSAGPLPPDPSELLRSQALAALVAEVRDHVDVVVVDGPPLLAGSEVVALSRLTDGTMMVARPDLVTRPQLREAHRLLALLAGKRFGVVANAVRDGGRYGYGTYAGAYRGAGSGATGSSNGHADIEVGELQSPFVANE
jgi:Mrp family chromosome partitioning ATPase